MHNVHIANLWQHILCGLRAGWIVLVYVYARSCALGHSRVVVHGFRIRRLKIKHRVRTGRRSAVMWAHFIVMALWMALLLGMGCGTTENECELSRGRISGCLSTHCEEGGLCSNQPLECSGRDLCVADCINGADCDAIRDTFSGMTNTEKSKALVVCTSSCGAAN